MVMSGSGERVVFVVDAPGDEALLVAQPAHQASRQVGDRSSETDAAGITPRPQARSEVGVSSPIRPRRRAGEGGALR